jgi:hypothetical protein
MTPVNCGSGTITTEPAFSGQAKGTSTGVIIVRGILLWLIGIPIPVILLLWLFGVLS